MIFSFNHKVIFNYGDFIMRLPHKHAEYFNSNLFIPGMFIRNDATRVEDVIAKCSGPSLRGTKQSPENSAAISWQSSIINPYHEIAT